MPTVRNEKPPRPPERPGRHNHDYDKIWPEVYGDLQTFGPAHRHMRRIVRRLLTGIDYRSVLDVGCGPGHNYDLLTKGGEVKQFDGLDISDHALDKARERLSGRFWNLDIQKECPEGTWDLVHCSLVLEHLLDDEGAIQNLRKLTGRYLLITTIAGNFARYRPWEERMGHVRNYRVGELESKLKAGGFEIREIVYWGFPFYSPIARTLQTNSKTGTGRYSLLTRAVAEALNGVYYLNSHRRGDLVILLGEVR